MSRNLYKVNEIFTSLQGEGIYTGRKASFIRFSGCNMKCTFCDTKHEEHALMTVKQMVRATSVAPFIIFTGGEPLLQLNIKIVSAYKSAFPESVLCVETNGVIRWDDKLTEAGISWVTQSPKTPAFSKNVKGELKLVYPNFNPSEYDDYSGIKWLQPCDGDDYKKNLALTIDYCMKNPQWGLSLQTQKIIGVR